MNLFWHTQTWYLFQTWFLFPNITLPASYIRISYQLVTQAIFHLCLHMLKIFYHWVLIWYSFHWNFHRLPNLCFTYFCENSLLSWILLAIMPLFNLDFCALLSAYRFSFILRRVLLVWRRILWPYLSNLLFLIMEVIKVEHYIYISWNWQLFMSRAVIYCENNVALLLYYFCIRFQKLRCEHCTCHLFLSIFIVQQKFKTREMNLTIHYKVILQWKCQLK